jgi:MinD superfamily P-loop ATPase
MKELVVISGKGGTGKTSLTAAFSSLAESFILCDADVDAPDLHLILKPEIKKQEDFSGGSIAKIDPDKCTQCGTCRELCRFDAISESFTVDGFACEGCGVCVDNCPEQAIDFPVSICGQWYVSDTRFCTLVHAALGIAEENSGKLVSLIRGEAKKIAEKQGIEMILTDGSPGVGCPVIASITGASAILIVSEPTVSGHHDMIRVAELAAHFRIPAFLCVNKFDLNEDQTEKIENEARQKGITVVGRIPFDRLFVDAVTNAQTVFEKSDDQQSETLEAIRKIWKNIMDTGLEDKKVLIPL